MTITELRNIAKNELQYGCKKILYSYKNDGELYGGMAKTKNEAMNIIKKVYESDTNNDYDFSIYMYGKYGINVLNHSDVISEIKSIN